MQSKAATVEQYLSELPPERRAVIEAVRRVLLDNLRPGFEEGMQYGMIGYYVPHSVYPSGYHCDPRQPLPFAGLASQKNYMSLYLMSVYGEGDHWSAFRRAWAKTGKKLDMGKCCIRFKRVEDIALEVVADAVRHTPVKAFVAHYEKVLSRVRARTTKGPPGQSRTTAKKKAVPRAKAGAPGTRAKKRGSR